MADGSPEKPDPTATVAASTKRRKPNKSLPTDRIKFDKQLDLLRAFVAASGPTGKAVTNKEVADIVRMAETTTTLANGFFLDTGLVQRADGGFTPSPEVISFVRAYEWTPETAAHKLRPLFETAWFGRAILPRVSFGPLEESTAITLLAEAVDASPDYRAQLGTVVDYMEAAGMIERDGSQIRLIKAGPSGVSSDRPIAPSSQPPAGNPEPQASRATVYTALQATQGAVQFHVSVKVDMAEFAGWAPDRIAAFFAGIAQVLAAKGAIEKGTSEDK